MSEIIANTPIWGTVIVKDKKYFLLDGIPVRRKMWQLESTIMWEVIDPDAYDVNNDETPVYLSQFLVFDSTAIINLLSVPIVTKLVKYSTPDVE